MKFKEALLKLSPELKKVEKDPMALHSIVRVCQLIEGQLQVYIQAYPNVSQSEVLRFISKLEQIKMAEFSFGKMKITTLSDHLSILGAWTTGKNVGTLTGDLVLIIVKESVLNLFLEVHKVMRDFLRYLQNDEGEILTKAIEEWKKVYLTRVPKSPSVAHDYARRILLKGYELVNAEEGEITRALTEFVDKTVTDNPSMKSHQEIMLEYFLHYSGQSVSRVIDYELSEVMIFQDFEKLIQHEGPLKMTFDGRATRWSQQWSSENGRFYCDLDLACASIVIPEPFGQRLKLDLATHKVVFMQDLHKFTDEEKQKLLEHPIVDAHARLTVEPDPKTGWVSIRVLQFEVNVHAKNIALNLDPSVCLPPSTDLVIDPNQPSQ